MIFKSASALCMAVTAALTFQTEASPTLDSIGKLRGLIPSSEVNVTGTREVFSDEDFKQTNLNTLEEELRALRATEYETIASERDNLFSTSPKVLDVGDFEDSVGVKPIVDDISMVHVPLDCKNLVLNPSFEDGTAAFWNVHGEMSNAGHFKKILFYLLGLTFLFLILT